MHDGRFATLEEVVAFSHADEKPHPREALADRAFLTDRCPRAAGGPLS